MTPLTFLPLGGAGEIGANLNVYGCDGQWLVVDCGAGFERRGPGTTDVFVPDPRFLAGQADRIAGMVVTHVHLDHLGAVADLWPRLRCPIYCTPFAAAMLRPRLRECGLADLVPIHERIAGARWQVGPFDVQAIGLTHSTVEMVGLAIRAGGTTVFHTGDFKLDPAPGTGAASDVAGLRALGDLGVDVAVADSTNATQPGWSRSEAVVHAALDRLLADRPGRIAVGLFASNVARIEALARIATRLGRHTVLVGRSMERTVHAAHASGYLRDVEGFVSERDVGYLPADKVLLVCTGTQAEPGSALQRIASDSHPRVALDPGDTVVFSSKIIPGNEEPIAALHAALRARGIQVVHELDHPEVHASGHPCRDELAELYALLRPTTVVPVHGEPRHLTAHAALARDLGMAATEVRNGDVLHLGPGEVRRVGQVPSGRILKDALQAERDRERERERRGKPRPFRGRR